MAAPATWPTYRGPCAAEDSRWISLRLWTARSAPLFAKNLEDFLNSPIADFPCAPGGAFCDSHGPADTMSFIPMAEARVFTVEQ